MRDLEPLHWLGKRVVGRLFPGFWSSWRNDWTLEYQDCRARGWSVLRSWWCVMSGRYGS